MHHSKRASNKHGVVNKTIRQIFIQLPSLTEGAWLFYNIGPILYSSTFNLSSN